jgi:hypothetical protein
VCDRFPLQVEVAEINLTVFCLFCFVLFAFVCVLGSMVSVVLIPTQGTEFMDRTHTAFCNKFGTSACLTFAAAREEG